MATGSAGNLHEYARSPVACACSFPARVMRARTQVVKVANGAARQAERQRRREAQEEAEEEVVDRDFCRPMSPAYGWHMYGRMLQW